MHRQNQKENESENVGLPVGFFETYVVQNILVYDWAKEEHSKKSNADVNDGCSS